ncbi:MAG: DUF2304 domain-containing protein [bacterium]
MYIIQTLLVVIFLIAIINVICRYHTGDLRLEGMVIWVLFWLIAGVVVVLPDTSSYFAELLGIGRGADLVVYMALVLLFFIVFKLMVRIEHLNKQITKLTRKNALEDHDK